MPAVRRLKRYAVERISRCKVQVEVDAYTAAEARRLVAQGGGESQDADYEPRGTGHVEQIDPLPDEMKELVSRR